jgi:putative transposase
MEARALPQEEKILEVIENFQVKVWSEIETKIIGFTKQLIEELLEEKVKQLIGAERYERTEERNGYRNGYYQRDLLTNYGNVEGIQVPRVTGLPVEHDVFNRYQRRATSIDAAIGCLFLNGISTRKLRSIARDLFGRPVSAATVSKCTAYLEDELKHYQERPLTDDVEFLFLDGITERVRDISVEKRVMLCAYGIHAGGRKEILSFQMTDVEDFASWRGFLVDLKSRGLLGKRLELITTDGNPALLKALKEIYPFIKTQRCIAHKLRNVVVKLKRSQQKPCMRELRPMFAAGNRKEAVKIFKAWRSKWIVEAEAAVRCMDKNLAECLRYYDFDKSMWKSIRTTNILERAFREVRRRTRPMNLFPNADSANRIFYGVTKNLNQNWNENPVSEFPQST